MVFMSAITRKQRYIGVDMTTFKTDCLLVENVSMMPNRHVKKPIDTVVRGRVKRNRKLLLRNIFQ